MATIPSAQFLENSHNQSDNFICELMMSLFLLRPLYLNRVQQVARIFIGDSCQRGMGRKSNKIRNAQITLCCPECKSWVFVRMPGSRVGSLGWDEG